MLAELLERVKNAWHYHTERAKIRKIARTYHVNLSKATKCTGGNPLNNSI